MARYRRLALFSSFFSGLVLVISSLLPGFALAATSKGPSSNGLRIAPVTTNITVNPGDTATVTVYAQNVTNSTVALQVVVNDFTTSDESGTPALLLNPGDYAPTHSLKRFVAPIGNLTLAPNEQKAVNVVITIPKGTSGGGYYGAVRFAPATVNSADNVTLAASVASLILVRVPGNFKEQLNLASIDVRQGDNGAPQVFFTSNNNLEVAARFQNVGDVQDQPFGKVSVQEGNTVLETHEINDTTPRGNVLPQSIRLFTVKLDKIGAFGKYTVLGNFGYGTSGQLLSGQTTFYVIPLGIIVAVLVVILLTLFMIFVFPKMVRRYNSSVIRRARRS